MATYREQEVRCPICGDALTLRTVSSYTSYGEFRELDGNTHSPEEYETVSLCPHCGYVSSDFSNRLDPRVPGILKSEAYQAAFGNEMVPENARKAYLAGLLEEGKDDPGSAGIWYLRAYWSLRDGETPEENAETVKAFKESASDKALEMLVNHIQRDADRNAAMVMVDLLRQRGEFDAAKEAVQALEKHLDKDVNMIRVAAFERGLIAAGDVRPHRLSEVLG